MTKQDTLPRLIIIDDDPTISGTLRFVLRDEFAVSVAASRAGLQKLLLELDGPPELVLLDLGLPPQDHTPEEGFKIIADLLAISPSIKILVLSGQDERQNVRHALALGAADFIAKPCDPDLLRARLRHALFIRSAEASLGQPTTPEELGIVGSSRAIENLRTQIRQLANAPFPVLVEGGSGSGKELVMQALHESSERKGNPFLVLNCAAISSQLIEAQIFGFAKGAFTGASVARAGFFEDAGNGTLCLDEIGEMPAELQAKLLRILENGEYYRLGETRARTATARIIAATNRDLKHEVHEGHFREDLYHRLSVFRIQIPPLDDREDDKLLLLDYFTDLYSKQLHCKPFQLSAEALAAWRQYHFPGNVRELRNIVIRLCSSVPGQQVSAKRLLEEFDPESPAAASARESATAIPVAPALLDAQQIGAAAARHLETALEFSLDQILKQWEQAYIDAALAQTGDNLSKTAALLGVNRTTLYSRMQRFRQDS